MPTTMMKARSDERMVDYLVKPSLGHEGFLIESTRTPSADDAQIRQARQENHLESAEAADFAWIAQLRSGIAGGGSSASASEGTSAEVLTRCNISQTVGPRMSGMPTTLCQSSTGLSSTKSSTATNANCDRLATDIRAGSPAVNALVRKNCPTDAVTPMPTNSASVRSVTGVFGSFHAKTNEQRMATTSATAEKCTTMVRGS